MTLGAKHIYLNLLYVRWFERFGRMGITQDRGSREDQQMLEELQGIPEQLPLYQQQVQRFFDLVLDVDKAGRDPQRAGIGPLSLRCPQGSVSVHLPAYPLSFEPVEPGRCSPVLYPLHISDMIDYSLRSCVERGITVRRCKNCGRWFPQTGRVSAEYCERPVASDQQTCREAGAFQQWTKKQSDDPVFKAYRKEYKKRFAWIKAQPYHRRAVLCLERAGQRDEKEMRPGGHHLGRVQGLAGETVRTNRQKMSNGTRL
ncbi:MAG: DUF6076 domain-containing protein [Flavonifractor plautii]